MTAPHRQLTGVDKLIMAAQMESNQPIPPTMPFYFREPPQIPTPRNKSELELYQLLRRANLMDYFPVFLNYGGDDVEQLAEASEEEFIEIVELIGMHLKPLHVRRLQKALSQWRGERLEAMSLRNEQRPGFYHDSPASFYASHAAPSATSNCPPKSHWNDPSNRSDNQTRCSSSLLNESIGYTSSASRSLFPVNQDDQANDPDTPRQYCTPHEVIRNAPKRPRLMDSIKPSDLTKGIQMYDSSVHSTPVKQNPQGRGPRDTHNNPPGDQQPSTPVDKRHPIQISPPYSADSDSDASSCSGAKKGCGRRKNQPTKSK